MDSPTTTVNKHQRHGPLMFVLIRIVSVLLIIVGAYYAVQFFLDSQHSPEPQKMNYSLAPSTTPGQVLPTFLALPSINVNASIQPVGLLADGSLAIPDNPDVGWYEYGPAPGQPGPAILDGHLDTTTGSAIFWNLKKLKLGDKIQITMSDGSTKNFKVDSLNRYSQFDFPTDLVYKSKGPQPILRLITCAGSYDPRLKRYTENLVVFGSLAD